MKYKAQNRFIETLIQDQNESKGNKMEEFLKNVNAKDIAELPQDPETTGLIEKLKKLDKSLHAQLHQEK